MTQHHGINTASSAKPFPCQQAPGAAARSRAAHRVKGAAAKGQRQHVRHAPVDARHVLPPEARCFLRSPHAPGWAHPTACTAMPCRGRPRRLARARTSLPQLAAERGRPCRAAGAQASHCAGGRPPPRLGARACARSRPARCRSRSRRSRPPPGRAAAWTCRSPAPARARLPVRVTLTQALHSPSQGVC